ncbi:MAG: methyltransferase domain-containing protein [Anaerolineales bacterium]
MKRLARWQQPYLILTVAVAVLAPPIPITETFSLRLEFILAGLLCLWLLPTEGLSALKHRIFTWMGLLAGLIVISLGYAVWIIGHSTSLQDTYEVAKVVVYAAIFYAASARSIDSDQFTKTNTWIQIIFLASATFGIVQYFDLFCVNEYLSPLYTSASFASAIAGYRIVGTTTNPNYFGMFMLFGSCLALTSLLWAGSLRQRWLSAISLTACVASLLLTVSRTVLAIFPIVMLFIAVQFIVRSRKDKAKLRRMGVIVAISVALLALILVLLPNAWFSRVDDLLNVFESESMQLKLGNWREHWNLYLQSPLFGHGPAKGLISLNIDNEWLLFLTRYGVFGPVVVFMLGFSMFTTSQNLTRKARSSDMVGFAITLQACLMAGAIFMLPAAVYHHQQLMAILLLTVGLGQGVVNGLESGKREGMVESAGDHQAVSETRSVNQSGGTIVIEASCPLCASTENEKRFVENKYTVLHCKRCELLFIDPYPSEMDVRESVASSHGADGDSSASLWDRYAAEVAFYDEHFGSLLAQCSGLNSLLEVGCGTGRLLELMSEAGLDCEGVELDPRRADAARARSGCTVHVMPVENLRTEKQFDVITLINVLSHIPSLTDLFDALARLLSDRGRLIIMAGEMRADVERGDALHWALPIHMHFLGFSTIEYICSKFGYRILHHGRTPYSQSLFSKARFRAPGRSRLRNITKGIVLRLPFALRFLRWNYERRRGGRVVTSLIVLAKGASAKTYA